MQEILDNIIKSRCGGKVERCHTIPHNGSYNNAAHSWGVAMLMFYLYPEDFPRLAIYCLSHDIGEGWVGDIPAPALWAMGEAKKNISEMEGRLQADAGCPREDSLEEEDLHKLKSCDKLELYLWCIEQSLMGNFYAGDCQKALEDYFEENPLHSKAHSLYLHTVECYEEDFLPTQRGIIQKLING